MERRVVLQRIAALGVALGVQPENFGLPRPSETDQAEFTAVSELRFEAGDPITAESLDTLRRAILALARVQFQAGVFHVEQSGPVSGELPLAGDEAEGGDSNGD